MFERYINEIDNAIARKFILRAMIGSINGALVGAASSVVRRATPEEASGIDGYNELRNDEDAPEPPSGTPEPEDPARTVAALNALKACLLDQCLGNIDPAEVPTDVGETIEWMASRPLQDRSAQLEALSKAVGIPVEELKRAQIAQHEDDQRWLKANKALILEVIETHDDVPMDEAWDQLPPRLQYRLFDRLSRAFERQVQVAVQAVLRGKVEAAGDIVILKQVIEDIGKMVRLYAAEDPQFKEAMEMAA